MKDEKEFDPCDITIHLEEKTTHAEVVKQLVDKVVTTGWCPKEEIIEHLLLADILYK